MKDGIIFDLDGTLWDATDVIAEAWSDAAKRITGTDPHFTADSLQQYFGMLMADIAAALFPEMTRKQQAELLKACVEEEHRSLLRDRGRIRIYEGLEDTLKELKEHHHELFIVSNCQAGYIEDFLEISGFGRYFTDHLCPGDTGNGKADNILQIMKLHHLKSPLYIGDTRGDYDASHEARVPFVFAAYGFGSVHFPDAVINDIRELPEVVDAFRG